jgi:hypothetical protein
MVEDAGADDAAADDDGLDVGLHGLGFLRDTRWRA